MKKKKFLQHLKEWQIAYVDGGNCITILGGHVYLHSLTSLPEGVKFDNQGNVYLHSLTSLPEGVKFDNQGNVYLHSLTSLPEGVKFDNQGDVYLHSLTSLPEGVKFDNQGNVNLHSLTSLPEGVKFDNQGNVYLHSLTSLPEGVKFDNQGDVYLHSLTSLPEGVKFDNQGYVNLHSLTSLPEGVKFDNQGNVYLHSLTSLPEGVKFDNQGNVYLHSLTSLPEGVKFDNQGDVYLDSLESSIQIYRGKKRVFRHIDGFTMLITSTHSRENVKIHKAKYFGGGEISNLGDCYMAEIDNHFAHGVTVKSAVEDAKFKALKHSDKREVLDQIAKTQTVSINDFRVITGACREGMRHHLANRGIDMSQIDSLPLDDALKAMSGSSFGDAFKEALERS